MASLRHGVGHSLHGAQRGGGLCHGLGVELVPRWNNWWNLLHGDSTKNRASGSGWIQNMAMWSMWLCISYEPYIYIHIISYHIKWLAQNVWAAAKSPTNYRANLWSKFMKGLVAAHLRLYISTHLAGGGGWLTPSDSRINAGFTNMSFEKKGTMLGNIMGYVDKTVWDVFHFLEKIAFNGKTGTGDTKRTKGI